MNFMFKKDGRNYIKYKNETKTIAEWAEILNVAPRTIYRRAEVAETVAEIFKVRDKRTSRAGMPTLRLEFLGKNLTLTEWAELLGCSREMLYSRYRRKLPVDCILSVHSRANRGVLIEYEGVTKTLAEWSRHLKIDYAVIYNRWKRGLPQEKILSRKLIRSALKEQRVKHETQRVDRTKYDRNRGL
ncbi:MAG: hypothetical protein E6R04_04160 [Spirochaetes bacterium]|nr:MAG: hypothetical protein E6R04_04160 [Spirochaetota bacterium]